MSDLTHWARVADCPIACYLGRPYNSLSMLFAHRYQALRVSCLASALLVAGQLALAEPAALAQAGQVAPATHDPGPRQVVDAVAREAISILTDKDLSPEARDARLKALMRQRMDLATLARLTVGNDWQNFTPQQRDEFVSQFADHLLGLYTPLATLYAGQHVELGEDHPESNGDHTVVVLATDRKGPAGSVRTVATIAARMRKGADDWRAIDVTIEGVSIAQTFRSQFRPVIARSGIDSLIEILRQKNAQARSGK